MRLALSTVAKIAIPLIAGLVVLALLYPVSRVDIIPMVCSSAVGLDVACDGGLSLAAGAATAGIIGLILWLWNRRRVRRTSSLPPVAVVGGALLLGLAVSLPWAYVGGEPVHLDWVGVQAIIPTALLGVAAIVAIASPQLRRWAVLAVGLIGLFAGYSSLALARAIPTMAAVWASSDGSRGPAFVAILAAEAILILAAWATQLPARSRDKLLSRQAPKDGA
jgi:hypothetical protein